MNYLQTLIRKYTINAYKIDELYAKYAKRYGYNESDLCLFYALYPDFKLTQSEICKEWGLPKSTINTSLKKYEGLGYLTLTSLPNNKKELVVSLTKKGKDNIKDFIENLLKVEEKVMTQILAKYGETFFQGQAEFVSLICEELNK